MPLILSKQPYHILFISGLLIFLISFFTGDRLLNIGIYQTNYLLPETIILLIFSIVLFVFWMIYRFSQQFFYSFLWINIHAIVTALAFFAVIVIYWNVKNALPVKSTTIYYNSTPFQNSARSRSSILENGLLLLLVMQFIFVMNLLTGIIKYRVFLKHKKKRSRRSANR